MGTKSPDAADDKVGPGKRTATTTVGTPDGSKRIDQQPVKGKSKVRPSIGGRKGP